MLILYGKHNAIIHFNKELENENKNLQVTSIMVRYMEQRRIDRLTTTFEFMKSYV